MKRCVWTAAVVVLCLVGAACQQAGGLSDQDKAAIQKSHDEYAKGMAAAKPDPAALVKMYYAPDARVLMPNLPALEGQDTIIKAMMAEGPARSFTFGTLSIDGRGDVAYVHGTYEGDWAMPGSNESMHDKGKFVEVWGKQADGTWKASHDIWNSDLPVAGLTLPTGTAKANAGPELRQLDWFAGNWVWEADMKVSPFGPAGKATMRMDCRWFTGGQPMLCKVDGVTPGGPYHELMIMAYDVEAKSYKAFDMDTTGLASPYAMTFKNGTWTFDYDLMAGGKPLKMKVTLSDLTKDSCSFKQEMAMGGGPLVLVGEGKCKKVG